MQILRPEDMPENEKAAIDYIEQQQRIPTNLHEGCPEQERQEEHGDYCAGSMKSPLRLIGKDPYPPPAFVDSRQRVAKRPAAFGYSHIASIV